MTNKEAISILSVIHLGKSIQAKEACDLAIKVLEERDDLLERAYGHVVGQGANGIIREIGVIRSDDRKICCRL